PLAEDLLAVDDDVEDAAAARDQVRLHVRVLLPDRVHQTGGEAAVASGRAVSDIHLHCVPPLRHDEALTPVVGPTPFYRPSSSRSRPCGATINSSLVGMTHTCTRLCGAWNAASPNARALASGSSWIPNQSRRAHTASRILTECSPIPPVKTIASAPPR